MWEAAAVHNLFSFCELTVYFVFSALLCSEVRALILVVFVVVVVEVVVVVVGPTAAGFKFSTLYLTSYIKLACHASQPSAVFSVSATASHFLPLSLLLSHSLSLSPSLGCCCCLVNLTAATCHCCCLFLGRVHT